MRKTSIKQAILIASVAFLSGACATLMACGADAIQVFAWNLDRKEWYRGKKEAPSETIDPTDSQKLQNLILIYRQDWASIKRRLATCE